MRRGNGSLRLEVRVVRDSLARVHVCRSDTGESESQSSLRGVSLVPEKKKD